MTLKDGRVIEHETPRGQILGNITGKLRDNGALPLSTDLIESAVCQWQDVTQVVGVSEAIWGTLVR